MNIEHSCLSLADKTKTAFKDLAKFCPLKVQQ